MGRRRAHRSHGRAHPPRPRKQAHSTKTRSSSSVDSPLTKPTTTSPRSSTSKAGKPAPGCRSPPRAFTTCASSTTSRPRRHRTPTATSFTIDQAAERARRHANDDLRWLEDGLLAGQQTTPGAAWRIRLDPDTRAKFVPDVPDGYLPLDQAAKALGVARQTVLHKVQRGELTAIQVTQGRRKGLRINVSGGDPGLFAQR